MTEQQPDNDKTFKDVMARVSQRNGVETITESIGNVALLLGAYRRGLVEQGFSPDEAMALVGQLQTVILGRVTP